MAWEEQAPSPLLIKSITLRGFKSFRDERTVELRPLTILAGANSSGKSTLMQAVLLLKQSVEAPFDPGPLQLAGPNVEFSRAEELLWRAPREQAGEFEIGIEIGGDQRAAMVFQRSGVAFEIVRTTYGFGNSRLELKPVMSPEEIRRVVDILVVRPDLPQVALSVGRNRCFLDVERGAMSLVLFSWGFVRALRATIHLPGLRGNPLRTYPVGAVGGSFPGRFHEYAASVLAAMDEQARHRIDEALRALELTWKVEAKQLDATRIEIKVGRRTRGARGGAQDLVNIADVGFGLSQVLPVLVALAAASGGQILFIEQPEIHLHPRAQTGLAKIILESVKRGAQVVIETHSELLLLAIQRLVAEGLLPAEDVILHWFARDEAGATTIRTGTLDPSGAYGDWPVDFAEVALEAERTYQQAAFLKLSPRAPEP